MPQKPESPINDDSSALAEDQNPPINQPESNAQKESISAPNEPEAPVDDQPISEPVHQLQYNLRLFQRRATDPTAPQTQRRRKQNRPASFARC